MDGDSHYAVFLTDAGWMGVLASAKGLRCITLPLPSQELAVAALGGGIEGAEFSLSPFQDLIGRLRRYFAGQRVSFSDRLDLTGATSFQKAVWKITREIPYGETRSYAWLAGRLGRPLAARAVGQALKRNPLPVIIPCHRVVAADGRQGGFSGGVAMKRFLLGLEGHCV